MEDHEKCGMDAWCRPEPAGQIPGRASHASGGTHGNERDSPYHRSNGRRSPHRIVTGKETNDGTTKGKERLNMTTNKEDIRRLLDLYMEGKTSLEEEALLMEYFRSPDADKDFADFKTMFNQFDEGEPSFTEEEQERWMQSCPPEATPTLFDLQAILPAHPKHIHCTRQTFIRWIAVASIAAACFFLGTTVSRKGSYTAYKFHLHAPTVLTEVKWKTDTVFIEKPVPTTLTAKIITIRDTIILPASHPKDKCGQPSSGERTHPPPERAQYPNPAPPDKTQTRQPNNKAMPHLADIQAEFQKAEKKNGRIFQTI